MMKCRLKAALAAAVLIFAGARPAFAQKITGDITGTVTDTTGAVLPGVVVNAVCPETNFTRTATTDERGGYSLPELPVCTYKVSTSLQGFRSVTRDVQVAVKGVAKTEFKLDVGAQSETATVAGVSPLIEFSDKLNNNVDTARI